MNALDACIVGECLELAVRHLGDARLEDAEAAAGLAAIAFDEVDRVAFIVELDDDVRLAVHLVFYIVVEGWSSLA